MILLSRYNLIQYQELVINGHGMPWIFLSEEEVFAYNISKNYVLEE